MMYMIIKNKYNIRTGGFDKTIKNIIVGYENVVKYCKRTNLSFPEESEVYYTIPEGKHRGWQEGFPTIKQLQEFGPQIRIWMMDGDLVLGNYQIIPLKKFKKVLDKRYET